MKTNLNQNTHLNRFVWHEEMLFSKIRWKQHRSNLIFRRPRPTTRPDPQGTLVTQNTTSTKSINNSITINNSQFDVSPLSQLTDYIRGLFNQRQPANQRQPIRGNQRQGPSKSSESVVLARAAGPNQQSSFGTQTRAKSAPRWTPIYTKWNLAQDICDCYMDLDIEEKITQKWKLHLTFNHKDICMPLAFMDWLIKSFSTWI